MWLVVKLKTWFTTTVFDLQTLLCSGYIWQSPLCWGVPSWCEEIINLTGRGAMTFYLFLVSFLSLSQGEWLAPPPKFVTYTHVLQETLLMALQHKAQTISWKLRTYFQSIAYCFLFNAAPNQSIEYETLFLSELISFMKVSNYSSFAIICHTLI